MNSMEDIHEAEQKEQWIQKAALNYTAGNQLRHIFESAHLSHLYLDERYDKNHDKTK